MEEKEKIALVFTESNNERKIRFTMGGYQKEYCFNESESDVPDGEYDVDLFDSSIGMATVNPDYRDGKYKPLTSDDVIYELSYKGKKQFNI